MSKKQINIYDAINSLPDELITPEIYEAGIKEGNIKLLDLLPEEYLTEDNINAILDNTENNYSWNTFSLSAIPEKARTQKVCDAAVEKSLDNYLIVPEEKRTNEMLMKIMGCAEKYIHLLSSVPALTWDETAVYKGIRSIYGSGNNSSYGKGRYYSNTSPNKKTEMKLIQILLAHVPENIKNKAFYFGLFSTSMNARDVDFLVPDKHKKTDYYPEMGKKSIKDVPVEKLTYAVIKAALLSEKNHEAAFWGGWNEKSPVTEPMLELMDGKMADILITKWPARLSGLPEELQTKNRLILALDANKDNHNANRVYGSFDVAKFDDDICRAIVKLNEYSCPVFAPEIWTPDFVSYCMGNARSYYWFERMPEELQTQEIVGIVLEHSIGNIKFVRPEFITYEFAVEAYRYKRSEWSSEYNYREYVPKHYLDDFTMETGLPVDFFGGETTYSNLKNNRNNYTYCRIGECYIGFFIDKDGREEYNRLIMTRRNPAAFKPSIVFSRIISAFHKTWLEKLVADNASQFVKPVPAKGLKIHQRNPYMDVRTADTVEGTKIYGHSFLGETVLYTVAIEGCNNEFASLNEARRMCKSKVGDLEIAC